MIDLSETFYICCAASGRDGHAGDGGHIAARDAALYRAQGGQVELTVDIEDGSVQSEVEIDGLPTVRKSNISTLAVVGISRPC